MAIRLSSEGAREEPSEKCAAGRMHGPAAEKQERVQRSLARQSGAGSVRKKTQDEARMGVWVKGEAGVMMDDNDPAQVNHQVLFGLGPGQPDFPHVSDDGTPGVGQGRSRSVVGSSPSVRRPTWRSPRCTQA